MTDATLYDLAVTHRRFGPRPHALRSRIAALLLDLDGAEALARACRLFSVGRRNLVSFHPVDHGDGAGDLRGFVDRRLAAAGLGPAPGPIRLLAMPRLAGRAFNPIGLFLAHDAAGALAAVIYDVHNTFGGRHAYVMPAGGDETLRHAAEKRFHVSPFLPGAMRYRFALSLPREGQDRLSLAIAGEDASGRRLIATAMHGVGRPVTDRALLAAALRAPLQGARVLAEIHLHALALWAKGARFSRAGEAATRISASGGC